MINEEEVIAQARKLHLSNVKNHLEELLEEAEKRQFSYIAFLDYVFEGELECRKRTAQNKRIREACFPYQKRFEDFDFSLSKITERQAHQLAELKWIKDHYNIMLIGPPGTGKTHLSIALGILAAENGFTVSFVGLQELISLLRTEEIMSRSRARLERIRKSNLIIIDEVGYLPVSSREAGLFFHLLNEVYINSSIIITSNKPFDKWAEFFGDSDMVLAALDRLLFRCEVLKFEGDSYRIRNRKTFLE